MAYSQAALAATAVVIAVSLAPLLAGGWPLRALPVLLAVVAVGWISLFVERRRESRSLGAPLLSLGFGLLAAYTVLQIVPLGGALELLSPRAAEVRSYVAPDAPMIISYERSATWREAAKMLLYGLVAALSFNIGRRRSARFVLRAVVGSAVLTVLAALAHRILHVDALWGVFDGMRPAWEPATTFQNPNHASAFLCLGAIIAAGLGVDAQRPALRGGWLVISAGLVAASLAEPSKGGFLALVVGLVLFGVLLWRRGQKSDGKAAVGLFAAILVPLAVIVARLDALARELGLGEGALPLGLMEKLAAVQNAWPLVWDHAWTGIGRGAYISVYPHYQTSPLQLTFAFPENILAQLCAEWGLLVGGLALIGIFVAVADRLANVEKPSELAAMAGIAAVFVHDLVDFSLELPGVAVPVVALLGALTPGRREGRRRRKNEPRPPVGFGRWRGPIPLPSRLDLRKGGLATSLALAPVAMCGMFIYGAERSGDLGVELKALEEISIQSGKGERVSMERGNEIYRRHPANVLVASQVAYLRARQQPPDSEGAMRAVNRALYLGPRYADAHVLAGRLLLQAGHRSQAFGELRIAWALTRGRDDVLATARSWAKNPAELLYAIPRADPVLDTVDVHQVVRLVAMMVAAGEVERGAAILERIPPVDEVPDDALEPLARAALLVGMRELALEAGRRGAKLRPDDRALTLTFAQLAERAGHIEEARELADSIPLGAVDPRELLELRYRLALAAEDFEAASDTLEELRRRLPVSRETQTALAIREARLHLRQRRPDRAVSVLGRAVDWSPSDFEARLLRAQALDALGRHAEAKLDIELVLRRDPEHAGAKRLLERSRVSD